MSHRVDSGSGGNFFILFGHMLIVRAVQHENLLINSLSIKFSKFPPLPESTSESTLLGQMRMGTTLNLGIPLDIKGKNGMSCLGKRDDMPFYSPSSYYSGVWRQGIQMIFLTFMPVRLSPPRYLRIFPSYWFDRCRICIEMSLQSHSFAFTRPLSRAFKSSLLHFNAAFHRIFESRTWSIKYALLLDWIPGL